MNQMNRTTLLTLLSRCQRLILRDTGTGVNGNQSTGSSTTLGGEGSAWSTAGPTPTIPDPEQRKSYDNAYFYIMFVMLFYFFLAGTLFKNFLHGDNAKKDPYEEFISPGRPSAQKFNPGPTLEGFDFEEESSL